MSGYTSKVESSGFGESTVTDPLPNTSNVTQESTDKTHQNIHFEFIGVDSVDDQTDEYLSENPLKKQRISETTNKTQPIPVRKEFVCLKCGFGSDTVAEFKEHLLKHRGGRSFRCSVCNITFKWMEDLRNHTTVHAQVDNAAKVKYGCVHCQYTSNLKTEVAEHSLSQHGEEIVFKCDICDMQIKTKGNFERHMKTHNRYTCDYCPKSFHTRENYDTHMASSHSNKQKFKCASCHKCFSLRSQWLHHWLSAHGDEKRHKCDKCDYGTDILSHLMVHRLLHVKEKPYKCKVCGYKCTQAGNMTVHMRTHTGDKPYRCDECDYVCAKAATLENHAKTSHGDTKKNKRKLCSPDEPNLEIGETVNLLTDVKVEVEDTAVVSNQATSENSDEI